MMRIFFCFVFLFALTAVKAQIPERPSPQRLYNNLSVKFPDFLNPDEAEKLEKKLEQFSNETSNQICVVIVDDLNGMETMDYATRLLNQWGVGKQGKDNGVVILVKPTEENGGRDLAIATGYGLEAAIPDLATARVRDEEITPYLKNGQYYTALDKGTTKLMQLAKKEINVKDYSRTSEKGLDWKVILIVILIILYLIMRRRGGGGYTYTGRGRSWGGGWGGGFGGWGSGSSGGGGWGGFGGGRSGGGGSSGKW
jgi:uncharacterized protein